MKRISYFPFSILFVSLFFLLSLPKEEMEGLRSKAIGLFSYPWRMMHSLRCHLLSVPTLSEYKYHSVQKTEEYAHLLLENETLHAELHAVCEWLLFHERMESEMEKLKLLMSKANSEELFWREFFQRRSEELKKILELQIQALPASVIFREPSSWNSSLWLNVGERNNEALGRQVVAKNSPVLSGQALVGMVEYVDKTKCRVRLITDSGLIPSVRTLRGKEQNLELLEYLEGVLTRVTPRDDLFDSELEKNQAVLFLGKLKEKLFLEEDRFLAKGEIMGSSLPLWRCDGKILKGIGFNYDYADKEGPARELRTGRILDKTLLEQKIHEPLLKNGDLLVTSGLDGVFPPGLHVAIVTEILPLEEGAYAYEIRAKPCAPYLNELSTLFVLPPLEN